MHPLSAAQLLDAWEQGLSEPVYRRALPLLAAASPGFSIDAVAALSIGERDRWLLTLREWTFGSCLVSIANCSGCEECLEWAVDTADLYVERPSEPADGLSLETDRYRINFRTPNTADLAAIAGCADITTAHNALLERCVLKAEFESHEIPADQLPNEIVTVIARRMAEADPQADLKFDLVCPACGRNCQVVFDIGSFFWSEINVWAQRILLEVHLLASAYGWREIDILNLSPWRRQFYLGLATV
jgi:hypothetical protein